MRTYVDTVVRVSADGAETPLAVVLPDGRAFEISQVSDRRKWEGCRRFAVRIGRQVTYLYKDTSGWGGPRWFVVMKGAVPPVFESAREWVP